MRPADSPPRWASSRAPRKGSRSIVAIASPTVLAGPTTAMPAFSSAATILIQLLPRGTIACRLANVAIR